MVDFGGNVTNWVANIICDLKSQIKNILLHFFSSVIILRSNMPFLPKMQLNCPQQKYLSSIYRTRVRSLAMLFSNWLPNWLTHSCLVNFIDLTLACEDNYSKLVEVVTVADVDEKDRVGNSLLQIW